MYIVIEYCGVIVVDICVVVCMFEISYLFSYYILCVDIVDGVLCWVDGLLFCEWKGVVVYWDVVFGDIVLLCVGWSYLMLIVLFVMLWDYVVFYVVLFDWCSVDGEIVML